MKNFLGLIIAATSFLPTNAQQVTFEKWYDYGFAEAGYCVQQTPDSGYIVAGRQGISFFSSKMLFLKTDKYGNTDWTTLLGDGSNDSYAYYIINCSAGGYAAVGFITGPGFVKDIYVVRLNNNGDTLWTKQYGTSLVEEGTCIQETADGDFVISFWDSNYFTGILKIDSLGNLLWWKSYYLYDGSLFKNLTKLSNGGFLLTGIALSGSLFTQGILMMVDSLGDSVWVKNYGGISGEEFYEAQETSDGNIIVGGISGEAAMNSGWGVYILKINLLGDTIWTRRISTIYSDYCYSIRQCTDGGYILGGTSNVNGDASAYLLKFDLNGDTLWTRKYGGTDDDYGYFVRQTFDGGYILVGMTSSWNPVDVYLLKIDSVGNLITGISEIVSHDMDFTIYPNPTRNFIYIKSNEEIDKLLLFDTRGKLLFMKEYKKIIQEQITIDLSYMKSGVYYLHLITSEGTAARKIIKL